MNCWDMTAKTAKTAKNPLQGKTMTRRKESLLTLFLPFDFTGGSEKNLTLTFVPGLSSEDFDYEVVSMDSSGKSEVYDADYNEGVCTCSVQTIPYEKVIFTARISDGNITLSQALFSVTDEGDNMYTHEELWNS